MLEKFDLSALLTIDGGRIRAAFDQAIAACERDCKDRPALGKFRTVSLQVAMRPIADERGELESCDVLFKIDDDQPKRESRVYNMRSTRGGLVFNELSPDDVRQQTIPIPAPVAEGQ